MKIFKKEKTDIKKYLEDIKANRTNRTIVSIDTKKKQEH